MRAFTSAVALAVIASSAYAGPGSKWPSGAKPGAGIVDPSGTPARSERTVRHARSGAWQTIVDAQTGVVTRMLGSYVAVPGAVRDPAIAERAARAFLAAHLAELAPGSRVEDFVPAHSVLDERAHRRAVGKPDPAQRTVAFVQTHRGLRVVGGSVHFVFGNDRLFLVGSEALPNVTADLRGTTANSVIVPFVSTSNVTYRAATLRRDGDIDTYLGPRGEVVAREDRRTPVATTLRFVVPQRNPMIGRDAIAAPRAQVRVDGGPLLTTDLDGVFDAPATATITTTLAGPDIRVQNVGGAVATAMLPVEGGSQVIWGSDDPLVDAQLSGFIHASIAKARGRQLAPAEPWLATRLDVFVNATNNSCNALATPTSISFFAGTDQCENTARIADVVYHEFAHSLHDALLTVPTPAPSLREGVADYFAATITRDSGIGRGVYRNDDPVRDIGEYGFDRKHPTDVDPTAPHVTGLILGEALWDMETALADSLGGVGAARPIADDIFLGILRRARDIPTAYAEALAADDDDGDLGNGTPHGCLLEAAFGRHALAINTYFPPSLTPAMVDAPLDTSEPHTTISATAGPSGGSQFGCPVATITKVELVWRLEGDAAQNFVPMTAEGALWRGELPQQPEGTVVRYRVFATGSDGTSIAYPQNRADLEFQHFFGTGTKLFCQPMDADPNWQTGGSDQWEWAMIPPAGVGAGDPVAPYSGIGVLGTKVRGMSAYLDSSNSRVESAPVDATQYATVRLQFWRHLAIEDGRYDQAIVDVDNTEVWRNATTGPGTLHHVDKQWRFVDLDISEHAAAGPLRVGWRLTADESRQLGGWSLDDVCVVGLDKYATCGDGVVDDGEECDDANAVAGDGCTPRCETDVVLELGCCSASRDPYGPVAPLVLGGLVVAVSRRRRRR